MGLSLAGGRPAGVRKIEMMAPEFGRKLRGTVAGYAAAECLRALRVCVELYRAVRPPAPDTQAGGEAERAALEYVTSVERRCGLSQR